MQAQPTKAPAKKPQSAKPPKPTGGDQKIKQLANFRQQIVRLLSNSLFIQAELKVLVQKKFSTDREIPQRFQELSGKLVGKFGEEIVLNLDSLTHQKNDPRVAAAIIEMFPTVKKIILFSDLCHYSAASLESHYKQSQEGNDKVGDKKD